MRSSSRAASRSVSSLIRARSISTWVRVAMAAVLLGRGWSHSGDSPPRCAFAAPGSTAANPYTAAHDERRRRRRPDRERARSAHTEVCHAWWDLNVVANEENERRRVELETALSDFLADSDRFAAIEGAREAADGSRGAGSTSSATSSSRSRRRPSCARGSSSSRRPSRCASRSIAARSRAPRRRQRDPADPARERRRRRAARGLGGVEDGRRARRRRRPRARAAAQRGRPLARLPRLVRALGRDVGDGRGQADGHARRGRPRDRRAVRALEGASSTSASRPASAARRPSSRRGTTPTPFFQEVPAEGGVDLDPLLEGADLVELSRRTYDGIGLETRAVLERSDLFPRDGKCQHAFCIDIDRAGDIRVLANVVPEPVLDGHDAARARPRDVRRGLDPSLPWLLRDTHLVVTEGIAILMGRLASDAEWLERVLGVDPGDRRRDRGRSARGTRRRAARLHPLGARDDELRALALRRSRVRPRRALVGARRALPARHAARRAAALRTGPRRSTSPARPSTTTPISTGRSSPRSSPRRWSGSAAGSSSGPSAGRLLAERVFAPGLSVRWDRLIEQATGEPLERRALRPRHRRRLSDGRSRDDARVPRPQPRQRRRARPRGIAALLRRRARAGAAADAGLRLPGHAGCAPASRQVHLFERPGEPPSHAHFALEIDDFMPVYRRMKELGALDHETLRQRDVRASRRRHPDVRPRPARQPRRARLPRRLDDPAGRGARVQAARRRPPRRTATPRARRSGTRG